MAVLFAVLSYLIYISGSMAGSFKFCIFPHFQPGFVFADGA